MNDYFNTDTFPEYIKLIKSQEYVPGQDFDAQVYHNLFSEEEWLYVKQQFDNCPDDSVDVQGYAGLGTLNVTLLNEKDLLAKIERIASDAIGEEVEVLEYGGTRYSPRFGWYPKLGPHYDARPVEIFVFDYHVQSDEDWGVFIDGKKFNFYNNDALLFSGTGRVHWREQLRLKENSNVDLIFFWLQHKTPKPISKQHVEIMRERASLIIGNIDPMPSLKISQWWEPVQISDNIKKFPDFKKISTDNLNPLTHNTIYRDIVNNDIVSNFYKDYAVSTELQNKIINFMTHIHAESKIKFLDSYFVKYHKNLNNFMPDYNAQEKNVVSLAVKLDSNVNMPIIINEKVFNLNKFHALSLSHTNQNCVADVSNFNDNEYCDVLFFNFTLEDNND